MKCLLLRRKDWAESPSASPDSDAQPPARHPRRKGRQSVRSIVHAMTHHTREVEVPSSDRTGKQSRENSNHNLNAKRRRPLTKVNPLRSPDWLRRCAEMIAERTRPREPKKEPRNRPKSSLFCRVTAFSAPSASFLQVPIRAFGRRRTHERASPHARRAPHRTLRPTLPRRRTARARLSRLSRTRQRARPATEFRPVLTINR